MAKNLLKSITKNKLMSLMILFSIVVIFSIIAPGFLSVRNFYNLLQQVTIIGIIVIGQTFVIISKGIDLSQGSLIGLACTMTAMLIVNFGFPIWISIISMLLIGMFIGMANGLLIAKLKIPAFVCTLGSLSVIKGAALLSNGGNNIYNLPPSIIKFGTSGILGIIPNVAIILIVIVIVFNTILSQTRFGRYTYAIGSNEEASKLSGIRVEKYQVYIYMISGLMSAIGGIIMLTRLNSGVALAGEGYELSSITAVVIGGGSLFGGRGTIYGSLIGALIMATLTNGLQLVGISSYWQEVFIGSVLIVAVLIDNINRNKIA